MKDKNYSLGFTSLEKEIKADELKITGKVPGWLCGSLLRTGPAKFETKSQKITHWFDGFAMLHRFSFGKGAVSYANKFLHGDFYKESVSTGKISAAGFATDPCRSIFKRFSSAFFNKPYDNGNVNITRIADSFLALTETPLPVEFDPKTLESLGVFDFRDNINGQLTTAHPHYDSDSKESFNYITRMGKPSHYNLYKIPGGKTERKLIISIPAEYPSYMHSFAVTKNYIVLAQWPYKINPLRLLLSAKPFIENFSWTPKDGTIFIVISKKTSQLVGRYKAPAFFAFHHVNAYEDGNKIVLDIVSYGDASIIKAFYLDVLGGNFGEKYSSSQITRFVISLKNKSVDSFVVSDGSPELPRINYEKFNGKKYNYAYAVGLDRKEFINKLFKINVQNGKKKTWQRQSCHPGEPVFVQKPGTEAEDGGVLLSVVLDSKNKNSFLLVLDAKTLKQIATAAVPHHIPFGFHGSYYQQI